MVIVYILAHFMVTVIVKLMVMLNAMVMIISIDIVIVMFIVSVMILVMINTKVHALKSSLCHHNVLKHALILSQVNFFWSSW